MPPRPMPAPSSMALLPFTLCRAKTPLRAFCVAVPPVHNSSSMRSFPPHASYMINDPSGCFPLNFL